MTLKNLRIEKGLTQEQCAKYLGVSRRTYQNYESDEGCISSVKYGYIINMLEKYGEVDEEHGILTQEQIKEICKSVFKSYPVNYCYLFGSYAKGKASEKSDVDLLVSTELSGLKFYDMVEVLRESLKKKVDVLDLKQIKNNFNLVNEILADGIKIYG